MYALVICSYKMTSSATSPARGGFARLDVCLLQAAMMLFTHVVADTYIQLQSFSHSELSTLYTYTAPNPEICAGKSASQQGFSMQVNTRLPKVK